MTGASGINSATEAQLIGVGQIWQNFTGQRSHATSYQNTTGRPILVNITVNSDGNMNYLLVSDDSATCVNVTRMQYDGPKFFSAIVPDGLYYKLSHHGLENNSSSRFDCEPAWGSDALRQRKLLKSAN